jgi:hypothetical protein
MLREGGPMRTHGWIVWRVAAGLFAAASMGFANGTEDRPPDRADRRTAAAGTESQHGLADSSRVDGTISLNGKAGIDRFDLDTGNVRESFKADGTIIVELNGEGMEKLTLTSVDGVPRITCGSILESWPVDGKAPVDFRNRAAMRSEGNAPDRALDGDEANALR